MQITVFGASGKVGSLVVEQALKRGHTVVAFVHSHNLFSPNGNLIIKQGDIYNDEDVSVALEGSEAVVSCLGSWGTKRKNVLTAAMEHIIPAMHEHKIRRIVTLTGSGAQPPGEKPGVLHNLMLRIPIAGAGKVFADGEEHMRLLASSGLDWTTLRSPVMKNGGNDTYVLSTGKAGAVINRQAVARAMLDELEGRQYLGQTPYLKSS